MNLILFASGKTEAGKMLEYAARDLNPEVKVEVCRSVEAFALRLRSPMWAPTIIVIMTLDRKELKDVLALRSYLLDRRIVLVLPDTSRDVLAESLVLRPRYFCSPESGFEEVSAVLAKMMRTDSGNNR